MVKSYKVWVVVEELDEEEGGDAEYTDMGLPDCLGEFDTFEEATAHIRTLRGWEFYPAGTTSDYQEGGYS